MAAIGTFRYFKLVGASTFFFISLTVTSPEPLKTSIRRSGIKMKAILDISECVHKNRFSLKKRRENFILSNNEDMVKNTASEARGVQCLLYNFGIYYLTKTSASPEKWLETIKYQSVPLLSYGRRYS